MNQRRDTNEAHLPVTRPPWADTSPDTAPHLSDVHRPLPVPIELDQWALLPPAVRAEVEAVVAHAVALATELDDPERHKPGPPRKALTGPELMVALMLTLVVVFAIVAVLTVLALAVVGS